MSSMTCRQDCFTFSGWCNDLNNFPDMLQARIRIVTHWSHATSHHLQTRRCLLSLCCNHSSLWLRNFQLLRLFKKHHVPGFKITWCNYVWSFINSFIIYLYNLRGLPEMQSTEAIRHTHTHLADLRAWITAVCTMMEANILIRTQSWME